MIIVGAFISLSACFFFKVEDARLHILEVLLLAIFIGLVIFVILPWTVRFAATWELVRSIQAGLRPTDESYSLMNRRNSIMKNMKKTGLACLVVMTALMLASSVMGQKPEAKEPESEGERPYEIFGGYSYLRDDGHNFNGWTGTFTVKVNRRFAFAADVDGYYGSHREGTELVRVREHGVTFGPHVALPNRSRITPFAFALFGVAHEKVKVPGVTESVTGFAANLGGGLDVRLNERVSVRLIQFGAGYTRFHGEGNTSPYFSTGLVFHFGKPR